MEPSVVGLSDRLVSSSSESAMERTVVTTRSTLAFKTSEREEWNKWVRNVVR